MDRASLYLQKYNLFLWLYLISPVVFHQLIEDGFVSNLRFFVLYLATSISFALLINSFVKRPFRLHLWMFPFYLTVTADLFLIFVYQSRLTDGFLNIILINLSETDEFLSVFGKQILAIAILLLMGYGFCLYKIRNLVQKTSARSRWLFGSVLLSIYLILIGYYYYKSRAMDETLHYVKATQLHSPFGVIFQLLQTHHDLKQFDRHVKIRQDFRFEAYKAPSVESELYVLIIGETARKHNWSLYGYERETNPLLAKHSNNLILLRDVITASPQTAVSVPAMLSLASTSQLEDIYSSKSIVSAFSEAGFKTYWLSTQELDKWVGFTRVISYDADSTYYYERQYDEVVVNKLETLLKEPYPKKLIVIHIRGSHLEYSMRYPKQFNVFQPSDTSWREHLVSAYDNSILYTDYVMDQIIKKVAALPIRSFIFHASDHGENLLDDDRQIFGHPFGTEYDLEIPAYIWFSDHAAKQLSGKLQVAARNANMPIHSNNLAHSMIDVAGIHTPHLDYSKSLFSESLRASDRTYLMPDKTLHIYAKPSLPEHQMLMSVENK